MPQEVTGPRLRGLLALLAGDLRTGCSTARLAEGLWPDGLPEHPAKALQVLVSRARAQLGGEVIATTPTGYRLTLSEDQVSPRLQSAGREDDIAKVAAWPGARARTVTRKIQSI